MKKRNVFFLLCFVLPLSCSQHTPVVNDLVKQRFEALNRHDLAALADLYSDSALIESPNLTAHEKGKGGIKSVYTRYFTSTPDLTYTITKILPGDSSVTVEYTSAGTMKHVEDTSAAYMLGKKYVLKNVTILEIRNNKITRDASYFDQVSFLRQMDFFSRH